MAAIVDVDIILFLKYLMKEILAEFPELQINIGQKAPEGIYREATEQINKRTALKLQELCDENRKNVTGTYLSGSIARKVDSIETKMKDEDGLPVKNFIIQWTEKEEFYWMSWQTLRSIHLMIIGNYESGIQPQTFDAIALCMNYWGWREYKEKNPDYIKEISEESKKLGQNSNEVASKNEDEKHNKSSNCFEGQEEINDSQEKFCFITKNPPTNIDQFTIQREKIQEEIVSLLIRTNKPIVIYGNMEVGKTVLAELIYKNQQEKVGGSGWLMFEKDLVITIVSQLHGVLVNKWNYKFHMKSFRLKANKAFTDIILNAKCRNKILVIDGVDNIEGITNYKDYLDIPNCKIIVTSEEAIPEFENYHLNYFDREEATRLFENYLLGRKISKEEQFMIGSIKGSAYSIKLIAKNIIQENHSRTKNFHKLLKKLYKIKPEDYVFNFVEGFYELIKPSLPSHWLLCQFSAMPVKEYSYNELHEILGLKELNSEIVSTEGYSCFAKKNNTPIINHYLLEDALAELEIKGLINKNEEKYKISKVLKKVFQKNFKCESDCFKEQIDCLHDNFFEEKLGVFGSDINLAIHIEHLLGMVKFYNKNTVQLSKKLCIIYKGDNEDLERALNYSKKYIAITKEFYGETSSETIEANNDHGLLLSKIGGRIEAIKHFKEVLRIIDNGGEIYLAVKSTVLMNIGVSYYHLKKVWLAEKNLIDSYKIGQKIYKKGDPKLSAILNNLGNLYLKIGDSKKGYDYIEKSTENIEKVDDFEIKDIYLYYNNFGICCEKRKENYKAYAIYSICEKKLRERIDIEKEKYMSNGFYNSYLAEICFNIAYIYDLISDIDLKFKEQNNLIAIKCLDETIKNYVSLGDTYNAKLKEAMKLREKILNYL